MKRVCDICENEINNGERFVCLVFSIERWDKKSNASDVIKAQELFVSHERCSPIIIKNKKLQRREVEK